MINQNLSVNGKVISKSSQFFVFVFVFVLNSFNIFADFTIYEFVMNTNQQFLSFVIFIFGLDPKLFLNIQNVNKNKTLALFT